MRHVARAPWDMLRGLHETCCEGSMGHVARAPWDMLQGLHETCCEGSMGHVARAPWDMLQGLHDKQSIQVFHGMTNQINNAQAC